MEDAGGEHGIGLALKYAGGEVIERTDTARGDHRHIHGLGHRTCQFEVEARLGAVTIHAGEQEFARAHVLHFARPFDHVEACGLASAMSEHFPARTGGLFFRINGDHDALRTVTTARLLNKGRILHRGGIDGDLVGAGVEQSLHVRHFAYAAADG